MQKIKLYAVWVFLVVLLCAGNSFSQTDSLNSGIIKGLAIDSTSELPIRGALVKLQETNNELLKYSETDENGAFTFEDIPYGIYEVQVVKEPYTAVSNI